MPAGTGTGSACARARSLANGTGTGAFLPAGAVRPRAAGPGSRPLRVIALASGAGRNLEAGTGRNLGVGRGVRSGLAPARASARGGHSTAAIASGPACLVTEPCCFVVLVAVAVAVGLACLRTFAACEGPVAPNRANAAAAAPTTVTTPPDAFFIFLSLTVLSLVDAGPCCAGLRKRRSQLGHGCDLAVTQ